MIDFWHYLAELFKEKLMKIELFMENPTDSFYQPLPDRQSLACARLGAKTAYTPSSTHSFMHSGADGLLCASRRKDMR